MEVKIWSELLMFESGIYADSEPLSSILDPRFWIDVWFDKKVVGKYFNIQPLIDSE